MEITTEAAGSPSSEQTSTLSKDERKPPTIEFHPGGRFWLAWISLMVIVLMAALDASSLSVALAKIADQLHGNAIEAFWAGISFLLTSTVFQPIIGSLSSIFGRKPLVLTSLSFFLVGAIIAALSNKSHTGMTVMLVGRSIQGIGGGGVIVLSEIIPTDMIPLRVRGTYLSMVGAMWAVGSVSGPLIGGAFAGGNNWPWIFWINLPFIATGGTMIAVFLSLNLLTDAMAVKLRRVDYVGIVLFLGSTTGFLVPLTWGGVMYSWSSWRTLVPLLVCAAGLVAFVVWEEKFAAEPLIPLRVLKTTTTAAAYLGTVLHGLVLWCVLYFGPLYYEAVKGYKPIIAGISLFPMTFTVAPAAITVGLIVGKTGRYRWSIHAGWFFATLGSGLMILFTPTLSMPAWIFIGLVAGVGIGLLYPGLAFGVQAAVAEADAGYASALLAFLRTLGQTLGVAIGSVVFQNEVKRQIASRVLIAVHAEDWSKDASALVDIIRAMPAGQARTDLITSYADALKIVWAVCCAFCGIGLIASIFIKEFDLDRELGSKQQFVGDKVGKTIDEVLV